MHGSENVRLVPSQQQQDMKDLIEALYRLAASLQAQAEAITQLAISNQEMANALLSQPDEDGEEQESGYLS